MVGKTQASSVTQRLELEREHREYFRTKEPTGKPSLSKTGDFVLPSAYRMIKGSYSTRLKGI